MRCFNYVILCFILFGLCSVSIPQETTQSDKIWRPQASIWVDISGTMKSKLESVIKDLDRICFYAPFKDNSISINGFYSRTKDPDPIIIEGFDSLENIRIPKDPSSTLSPLDKGLKKGIEEIKSYSSPDEAILFYVTDELIESKQGDSATPESIKLFRGILTNEKECPWVFFFDKGNYRIYVIIHYIPEEIQTEDKEQIVKRFLTFLDELSDQINQKAVLYKFDYPEKEPIFKASPTSYKWETKESGKGIDSNYNYKLSYMPKSYELIEGKFHLDIKDKHNVVSVEGFSDRSNISLSECIFRLVDKDENLVSDNTVLLKNISKGKSANTNINIKIPIPKHTWSDFLLFRDHGKIGGNIVGRVVDATFIPFQEEYKNLNISKASDRIMGSSPRRVDIGFEYDIKHPSWFWPLRVAFMVVIIGSVISIFALFTIRNRNRVDQTNIIINNAIVSKMDLRRDTLKKLSIDQEGKTLELGHICKLNGYNRLVFSPSNVVNRINGKEVEQVKMLQIEMKKDMKEKIDIELVADNDSPANTFVLEIEPITLQKKKNTPIRPTKNQSELDESFVYEGIDRK